MHSVDLSNMILFLIFALNCRKPAVVTKHTAVNEPDSADECEQDSVARNPNDATVNMEEIPEGTCSVKPPSKMFILL